MHRAPLSFETASQGLLDAAIDPSRWTDALDAVAQYADASGALLLPIKGRMPGSPHSESLGEALDEYYRDGWHERDERVRGLPIGRIKGIFTDQDFAEADELQNSDYYRGLLAKHKSNWSAAINFNNADDEWCLIIQRGDDKGFFDERAQADLVRFGSYMNQAATMARAVGYANAIGMLDAYEQLNYASFLIDAQGCVLKLNAKAEQLLGQGLQLSRRILRCAYPDDSLALHRAIVTSLNLLLPMPPVVAVKRSLQRPLIVRLLRLTGLAGVVFSPARALMIVTDPGAPVIATPADYAQKAFGLTSSEGRLVANLEQGLSLAAAANVMEISVETARTHLKRIFAKTDTGRQSDLLLLIRRLQPGD